jgi:prevent-host-death family protein
MKNTVTATELARNIGDVLARVRYRHESFIVERNGRAVARIVPAVADKAGTLREALTAWTTRVSSDDPTFADDLVRVNAADRPADNPWAL